MNKKIVMTIVATVLIAFVNILLLVLGSRDSQFVWVAFMLVWANLLLGWLTQVRQPNITYMFFSVAIVIEAIIIINTYWILGRSL